MLIDARTATFERIELLWKPAIQTRERVDRNSVPIYYTQPPAAI